MTEAARVLLTAVVLAGTAIGAFAVQLAQTDADSHDRLVGQLRLANLMAILLATTGAVYIGLAIANQTLPSTGLDVAIGSACVVAGALALSRAPTDGLLVLACAFLAHGLTAIAHRPGLLASSIAPWWYTAGSAAFDVYLAAICYWGRRAR